MNKIKPRIFLHCKECRYHWKIFQAKDNVWSNRIIQYWPDLQITKNLPNNDKIGVAKCLSCQDI